MPSLLDEFAGRNDISFEELRTRKTTVALLQDKLCNLGILDPVIGQDERHIFKPVRNSDGLLGNETMVALRVFYQLLHLPGADSMSLGRQSAMELDNAKVDAVLPMELTYLPTDTVQIRLAKQVLRYMQLKGYWIARHPDMCNIVYVEGMDGDGRLNNDAFDQWNDRRMLIQVSRSGQPEMLANDLCTSEPGRFYTVNPMSSIPADRRGAARIAFGQYKAWKVGTHRANTRGAQPALVQTGPVKVHRDLDKNGRRSSRDFIDIGLFGINQHSTTNTPANIEQWSAGCLVGLRMDWHLDFLNIVQNDLRYQLNPDYAFLTTVIAGDEMVKEVPAFR